MSGAGRLGLGDLWPGVLLAAAAAAPPGAGAAPPPAPALLAAVETQLLDLRHDAGHVPVAAPPALVRAVHAGHLPPLQPRGALRSKGYY